MFTWDEAKRQDYGEARQVCFGLLAGEVVVLVYTERQKRASRDLAAKGRKA